MFFAITFQQKYRHEEHPASLWTDLPITHQAFLVIEADNDTDARVKLMGTPIRNNYAFMYKYDADFQEQIEEYELFEIVLDEDVASTVGGGG